MKFSFEPVKRVLKKRTTLLVAFIASFLAAVCMLNVFINALTSKYGWYFYTEPKYEHVIGDASDRVLANVDRTKKTEIFFCMPSEELKANSAYSLVWESACQFAERYEFVETPKTLNTFIDTKKIDSYVKDENGNTINEISEETVIVDCGGNFRVVGLSDFFDLDQNQYITSYRGEEAWAYLIRYVMTENHPKALFTANHGEQSTQAMLSALLFSGYDAKTVNLTVDEIDEDAEFIFICSPLYDFETAAEGSSAKAEIQKLSDFIDRGGNLVVIKDPYAGKLNNLEKLLSDYGMSINYGIVSDGANSVTTNGRSVVAQFADNTLSSQIASRASDAGDMRFIVCESASLSLADTEIAKATPLVLSGEGAKIDLFDGNTQEGVQILAASAQKKGAERGSTVTLFPSTVTFSATFVNSDSYLNKSVLYSIIESVGSQNTPVGATQVKFETKYLEGLTVRESNVYAIILAVAVPLAVIAVGCVVLIRRKYR